MLTLGEDLVLNGNIDSVSPDGVIAGWCWSPDEPEARRIVCLAIDGTDIAETIAGENRPDLAAAGLGDGAHGFVFRLARHDIPDRPGSILTLRDVATGRMVGGELSVSWQPAPPPDQAEPEAPLLVGNLDEASQDGWVTGWAWYPAEPERRVSLDILVDGLLVGSTRAATFRADLQGAGIGDGSYGFSFALPWSVLANKGEMTLSARDSATHTSFGDPVTIRIGRLVDVEERIHGLERQVRLLAARLAEQETARDPAREARAARELFRTVAAFFHDMAASPDPAQPGAAAATPTGGAMLRHAVAAVLDSHAPLAFDIPERPVATLLLLGRAPRAAIYAALVALAEAGADRVADIVLLDEGRHGADLALLPAVARNLRYLRVRPGGEGPAARNEVAAAARGEVIVILSPYVRPAPHALAALLATVGERHGPALAGGAVLREDGRLEHAGFTMDRVRGLIDPGWAEDPARADLARMRPVDAVADLFFAVRRVALLEAGGFPPGYADSLGAVAGLCLALRARGQAVAWQPRARATLVEGGPFPALLSDEDVRRLRDRWAALS